MGNKEENDVFDYVLFSRVPIFSLNKIPGQVRYWWGGGSYLNTAESYGILPYVGTQTPAEKNRHSCRIHFKSHNASAECCAQPLNISWRLRLKSYSFFFAGMNSLVDFFVYTPAAMVLNILLCSVRLKYFQLHSPAKDATVRHQSPPKPSSPEQIQQAPWIRPRAVSPSFRSIVPILRYMLHLLRNRIIHKVFAIFFTNRFYYVYF